jgi:hypothetical protein
MSLLRWDNALLVLVWAGTLLACGFAFWLTFGHAQATSLSIVGDILAETM